MSGNRDVRSFRYVCDACRALLCRHISWAMIRCAHGGRLMLLSAVVLLSGCYGPWCFVPTYQYVLDKGDAQTIVAWTLEQSSTRAIADGYGALMAIAAGSAGGDKQAAADGLVAVHRQLQAGWHGRPLETSEPQSPCPPGLLDQILAKSLRDRIAAASNANLQAVERRIRQWEETNAKVVAERKRALRDCVADLEILSPGSA